MNPVSDPVYAPNSKGGPVADGDRYPTDSTWPSSGEMVRAPYTLRRDDDDFGQANTLINKVMDQAGRDRLVSNVTGHLLNGVEEPVLSRAFEYWRNIDQTIGDRIAQQVTDERAKRS
jgi:catalase